MSCGVGCRRGSDPALLWLWRRPAATAPIRPLAWEPPYIVGAAQETAKRQKKKKKKKKKKKGRNVKFQLPKSSEANEQRSGYMKDSNIQEVHPFHQSTP